MAERIRASLSVRIAERPPAQTHTSPTSPANQRPFHSPEGSSSTSKQVELQVESDAEPRQEKGVTLFKRPASRAQGRGRGRGRSRGRGGHAAKPMEEEKDVEEEENDDEEQEESEEEIKAETKETPTMKKPASKVEPKTSSLKRPASSLERKNTKVAKADDTQDGEIPDTKESPAPKASPALKASPAPKASGRAPATIVSERTTKNGWKVRGSYP